MLLIFKRMSKLSVLIAVIFVLAGCGGGVTGPCDDSDPVGVCATSHSHTYEGGR
jgi:hypothetical protein